MKYAAYLEIPDTTNTDGTTFRRRLFYFDKVTNTGNGGLSALDRAKIEQTPAIICVPGLRYTDRNGKKIIFPEMRLVTGFMPSEQHFISRYVFTLSNVEVDSIYRYDTRMFNKDYDAEETATANRLVERGFLNEVMLYSTKISFKHEARADNYWRNLFTYNGFH